MTIKSAVSADLVNRYLISNLGSAAVDLTDPTTWKYYLNISGRYHPTDTPMRVVSLDTLEEIDYTTENLEVHVATKEAYSFGTRYYYSLLNLYPEQDQLILGVRYPVNIHTAIAAKDGTILGYPEGLVEDQEETLIDELNEFIQGYMSRWNVSAFGTTDTLYHTAQHLIFYLAILPKLLNLRMKRCHTAEVHSFHIREYLASHQYLHRYLPYLTHKQAMFLYRNINYLNRNAGTTETFHTLIEKILTERKIPLSEYSIRQLNKFDDKHYPLITARRKAINDQFNVGEVSYVDTHRLYEKEFTLEQGNIQEYKGRIEKTDKIFQNAASSVVQTKDLESDMIDYSSAVPDPLNRVLMRQWAHMATHGLYDVSINFKDPKSGEIRTLYAEDALIYYLYIWHSSLGANVVDIPRYMNWKQRKTPRPTVADLLSVADNKFSDLPGIAGEIIKRQPVIGPCLSTKAFYETSYAVYDQTLKHWNLLSSTGDLEKRGMIEGMILQLYQNEYIQFKAEGTPMSAWLISKDVPAYDYTYEQAQDLMTSIFVSATGLNIDDTKMLKNIQKNLVAMMMELSSYTVQTIVEINDSPIQILNWPAVRPGNFEIKGTYGAWVETNIHVTDFHGHVTDGGDIEVRSCVVLTGSDKQLQDEAFIEVRSTVVANAKINYNYTVPVPAVSVTPSYPLYDPSVSGNAGYMGKEYFERLSDEEKKSLVPPN